jgi:hypothetical protein
LASFFFTGNCASGGTELMVSSMLWKKTQAIGIVGEMSDEKVIWT